MANFAARAKLDAAWGAVVGRAYARILGLVAFGTVASRGLLAAHAPSETLLAASGAMFAFAAAGLVVGELASWIVEESVQWQIAAEIAAQESPPIPARGTTGSSPAAAS